MLLSIVKVQLRWQQDTRQAGMLLSTVKAFWCRRGRLLLSCAPVLCSTSWSHGGVDLVMHAYRTLLLGMMPLFPLS
jgi:hypothetical protein